jgi:hypothetical protein
LLPRAGFTIPSATSVRRFLDLIRQWLCTVDDGQHFYPGRLYSVNDTIRLFDDLANIFSVIFGYCAAGAACSERRVIPSTIRLRWHKKVTHGQRTHYIIDWNYDEDRSRISTGYGLENMTRLRRFAIGLIKSKGVTSVARKMRQLTLNVRSVFDYLRMTKNACARVKP